MRLEALIVASQDIEISVKATEQEWRAVRPAPLYTRVVAQRVRRGALAALRLASVLEHTADLQDAGRA